jgi:hypothetical protein
LDKKEGKERREASDEEDELLPNLNTCAKDEGLRSYR